MRTRNTMLGLALTLSLGACASQTVQEQQSAKNHVTVSVKPGLEQLLTKALPITPAADGGDPLAPFQSGSTAVLLTDTPLTEAEILRLQNAWGRRPERLVVAAQRLPNPAPQQSVEVIPVFAASPIEAQRVYAYVNLPSDGSATQLQHDLQSWWDASGQQSIADAGLDPPPPSIIESNEVALGLRKPRVIGGYR